MEISHVSDTALWVAYFRAEESQRPDALFKDPLAQKLIGDRGEQIAKHMADTTAYTRQNVVIRTFLIDQFLKQLIRDDGVDTVINLGAGLDTRPYRLDLPSTIRWIEIDYPQLIDMKNVRLQDDKPRLPLERIALDLADRAQRKSVFARLANESKRAVLITEGVIPYLSVEDAGTLAEDLHIHPEFKFWITDYMAKETYKFIQTPKRTAQMKNAPFRFFPEDWIGFFNKRGWTLQEMRYIQQTTRELGRPAPMPLIAKLVMPIIWPFFPPAWRERILKVSGYMILKRT